MRTLNLIIVTYESNNSVCKYLLCFDVICGYSNKQLTLSLLKPEYFRITSSIALLMMLWVLVLPGYQQPWYWPCRVNGTLFSMRENFNYREISNISRTKSQNINVSHLVLQLSLPNPMKPGVRNEDVVGTAPTGDAPTTSEWSYKMQLYFHVSQTDWAWQGLMFVSSWQVIRRSARRILRRRTAKSWTGVKLSSSHQRCPSPMKHEISFKSEWRKNDDKRKLWNGYCRLCIFWSVSNDNRHVFILWKSSAALR